MSYLAVCVQYISFNLFGIYCVRISRRGAAIGEPNGQSVASDAVERVQRDTVAFDDAFDIVFRLAHRIDLLQQPLPLVAR